MIGTFNAMADQWMGQVVRATWQSGLLALVIFGVLAVWKRASGRVRCTLWWLVCLKMLVALLPISIALAVLPAPPVPRVPSPLVENRLIEGYGTPIQNAIRETAIPEESDADTLSATSYALIGLILLAGGMAFATGLPMLRLRRVVGRAAPIEDVTLTAQVLHAALSLGLRRKPRILITDEEFGPLLTGVARPVILLPRTTLESCSAEELRWIITHELAHVSRHDVLMGLVPQLARLLFSFNPVAWLACREYGLAREAACDEVTLQSLDAPRDRYARLLLKLGTAQRSQLALFVPGVSSHFKTLKRRILMIEQTTFNRSRSRWRRLAPLALLAFALVTVPLTLVEAQGASAAPPAAASRSLPVQDVAPDAPRAIARAAAPPSKLKANATIIVYVRGTSAKAIVAKLKRVFPKAKANQITLANDSKRQALKVMGTEAFTREVTNAVVRMGNFADGSFINHGVAVWRDANRNGIAEPQEVISVSTGQLPVAKAQGSAAAPARNVAEVSSSAAIAPKADAVADGTTSVQWATPRQAGAQANTGASIAIAPARNPGGEQAIVARDGGAAAALAPSRGTAQDAAKASAVVNTSAGFSVRDVARAPVAAGTLPSNVVMVSMITLKHVNAQRTAKLLTAKFGDKNSRIWADPSSNAVLIKGNNAKIRKIAAFLDGYDNKR